MRNMPKTGRWLLAFVIALGIVGWVFHMKGGDDVLGTAGAGPADSPSAAPVTPSSQPSETAVQTDSPTAPAATPPESSAKPTGPASLPSADPGPADGNPDDSAALPAWAADNLPSRTIRTEDDLAVITNASSLYVLVNKKRNLPSDYVPRDLTVPDVPFSFSGDSDKKKMRKEAAAALEKLFAGAEKAGIRLKAVSGYRSYARQKAIFDANAAAKGAEEANRTSAHPGQSEHQTGLAMDVSSASVGYALEESFGKTEEGRWLAAHAADYGFIIRYPKGKESITGYTYEPWHIRYLGKEAAAEVAESRLTLEQFFGTLEASAEKA
ncbi:M15 family metallopeptidase [Cohnella caldifontis]|uniref:M15 family metallopeptidase n=1 Tax=Cohnella caldifontis TaxID=3027471 RepID=UPI0023ECA47F|nr:D-alanyl-D-alanine carboxypeptidase family protein [Cohnella sp. YIM B05605]